jgi:hypothetical protein
MSDDHDMEARLSAHPCLFEIDGAGRVGKLRVSPDEPLWVTNLKRGIVSLVQVSSGVR